MYTARKGPSALQEQNVNHWSQGSKSDICLLTLKRDSILVPCALNALKTIWSSSFLIRTTRYSEKPSECWTVKNPVPDLDPSGNLTWPGFRPSTRLFWQNQMEPWRNVCRTHRRILYVDLPGCRFREYGGHSQLEIEMAHHLWHIEQYMWHVGPCQWDSGPGLPVGRKSLEGQGNRDISSG